MTTAPARNDPPKLALTPIEAKGDLSQFDCGVREINSWAAQKAHKFHSNGRARVKVARPQGGGGVCGFYSLTHSVAVTSKLLNRDDRDIWDNAPIIYIGYIAVARQRQRCGVGSFMLMDALKAAWTIHNLAPLYGVGLRSLNDDATRLYQRFGFRTAPGEDGANPLMILPIWTIRDLFGAGTS